VKKYAVIVAGGNGSRMNTATPKQFLLLKGKPVIYHTLNVFLQAYSDIEIILVLPKEHLSEGQKIINEYFRNNSIQIVAGGDTRFHSVKNGLQLIKEESIVFVHDGVRCLLTTNLIHNCYETAVKLGSAIPVIDSKDSVRIVAGESNEAIDRNKIKLVQTPQTFASSILLKAFSCEYKNSFTDEAAVVEDFGTTIHLVSGEADNIKITNPIDLIVAEKILETK
jgi:2-C-methyl-D-erythritol 4-phosphate cytidylyltransferase